MAAVLVTAVAAAVAVRYRHYGVYETHEDDTLVDDEDLLRNPVVVLDRNQESYINLKYPVLVRCENCTTRLFQKLGIRSKFDFIRP